MPASAPASVFTRSLVVIGKGARAMLIESHEGAAGSDYQVNTALEIAVGDEAHVDHIKITGEGAGALHVSSLMAAIGAHARFNEFLFTTAAAVVRNQLFVRFKGEGTVAGIRGATLLNGRQHADTTLVADHAAGACISREVFKTVLDGESRGVFQGKIIVRPHAQKTDAKMAAHALLLSEDGRGRQQARARDFRRRRPVRPRRDHRRARRRPAVLSEGARHSGQGGRGADDPGLRRRGGRRHRACRPARHADRARRRLAEDAGSEPDASRGRQRQLRRRPHPRGFPDPGDAGLRQAADLSRQRRLGAEAEGGARPHPARLHRTNTPTCIAACTISPMPRPRPTRARARRCAASSMPARPEEIIFTRNATEAINLVAYTFGRERIKAGDEIVLSIMEHHSNIVPWHFLRERQGAVIKWAPVDDDGNFLIDEFEKLLDAAHQDGRAHPHVECARHHRAGEGGGAARACPRHPGADRRQPGGGAPRRRRAGHRLRFLRLHRPQALRAVRHRRALRQARACSPPCRRSTAAAR